MPTLRVVPDNTLRQVAERAGFTWARRRGSHNTFRNSQGATVVIPDHGAQVIARPLTRRIIEQMDLSVEDYNAILDDL